MSLDFVSESQTQDTSDRATRFLFRLDTSGRVAILFVWPGNSVRPTTELSSESGALGRAIFFRDRRASATV